MRLACAWPLLIGLRTLDLLAQAPNWLDPARRPQGAAHPRLRHDGAVGGDGLVHARARPQSPPAPRAHPPMIPILQVDAFTERPFGGNPAAVVLDAQQSLRRADAGDRHRDAGRRHGVPHAGHGATTASGASAGSRRRARSPTRATPRWRPSTPSSRRGGSAATTSSSTRRAGRSSARVVAGKARRLIWLEPKVPALHPFTGQLAHVREALGLPGRRGLGACRDDARSRPARCPSRGSTSCAALTPNLAALGEVATHAGVRGVCLVSRETVDKGSATHCRFFAPHFGIPEDIVTGSVHSSIGVWLLEAGLLHADGRARRLHRRAGRRPGPPGPATGRAPACRPAPSPASESAARPSPCSRAASPSRTREVSRRRSRLEGRQSLGRRPPGRAALSSPLARGPRTRSRATRPSSAGSRVTSRIIARRSASTRPLARALETGRAAEAGATTKSRAPSGASTPRPIARPATRGSTLSRRALLADYPLDSFGPGWRPASRRPAIREVYPERATGPPLRTRHAGPARTIVKYKQQRFGHKRAWVEEGLRPFVDAVRRGHRWALRRDSGCRVAGPGRRAAATVHVGRPSSRTSRTGGTPCCARSARPSNSSRRARCASTRTPDAWRRGLHPGTHPTDPALG